MRFHEITKDNGTARICLASDNSAEYILTSAIAKGMYDEFVSRYNRLPSSRWYNRHFGFQRVK